MATIGEHITIEEIRHKGIPIIPGSKYIPKTWIPKKVLSLAQIRHKLAKIKGGLAETVVKMRKEK